MNWHGPAAALHLAGLRALGAAFLGWWIGELSALVPARLRRLWRARGGLLVAELAGDEIAIGYRVRGAMQPLGRIDLLAPDPARQLTNLLRARGLHRTGLALLLPAAAGLRTIITLPLAAAPDLRRVIQFELARHIPLKPEEVSFAFEIRERLPDRQSLRVELVVVPRSVVDEAVARLAGIGIAPARIEVATAAPTGPGHVLSIEDTHGAPAGRGRVRLALACGAALLAILAIYVPIDQERRTAAHLAGELAAAKAQARQVDQARQERDRLLAEQSFLVDLKRREVPAIAILDQLTHLLPDDTWLTQLQITGDEVQLRGEAASAASLIGILEASKRFRDPRFRSPVLQDAKSGRERFQIAVRIMPEPAK